MNTVNKWLLSSVLGIVAVVAVAIPAAAAFGFLTSVKPYAKSTSPSYAVTPILSVADRVPETSNPTKQFQLIGIPDGLGLEATHRGADLYVNHEVTKPTLTEPVVGDPLNRGSFVSKYRLARDGSVLSGERAYDTVYSENTLVGPAADATNATAAFSRFCSGFLANRAVGFSQPIYLAGEESGGADTYDGKGGSAVAIYNNEAHVLPKLGHFPKENLIVLPHTGLKTVIMGMEDGPSTPDSQLYMYVGTKQPWSSSVLRRNGLDNGKLYVLVGDSTNDEGDIPSGSATGHWVAIANADTLDEVQLEAAADAAGALAFIRTEDGAASPLRPGVFHFVTTGSSYVKSPATTPMNKLGRLYRLNLNPFNALAGAKLTVAYNADSVIAAGGDTALSPDNIDDNGRYLMVQEDGTAESRPVMGSRARDGSIWRYDTWAGYASERVVQLDAPGRDGVAVGPGVWETSGIIDSSDAFGRGSWVFDVQAHSPTAKPAPNTAEDGQILLMRSTH